MSWLSLFQVVLFLPCGGGGRCGGGGGCVGGGRHVDDELGEDVRGEEVDADADQLISLLAVVFVDEAVLDAHLGAPLLGTLQRRRHGSWPPDRKGVYFLPARCAGQWIIIINKMSVRGLRGGGEEEWCCQSVRNCCPELLLIIKVGLNTNNPLSPLVNRIIVLLLIRHFLRTGHVSGPPGIH